MPKAAWRSNTCITCRKRKVRCDQKRPGCDRCYSFGVACGGYGTSNQLSHPSTQRGSNQEAERKLDRVVAITVKCNGKQYCLQLLAKFMSLYMPSDSIQARETQRTVCLWYKYFPDSLGRSIVYDEALMALSFLYIGQTDKNVEFIIKSQWLYSSVSEKIANVTVAKGLSLDDLIGIEMTMTLYELYNPSWIHGWTHHVLLGCELLKRRGPPHPGEPFDRNLYRRVRNFTLYHTLCGRHFTFLAQPRWLAVSQMDDSYDTLLDILLQIPSLFETMESYSSTFGRSQIPEIFLRRSLEEFSRLEMELLVWFWDLQCNETEMLFYLDQSRPEHALSVPPDTSLIARFARQQHYELLVLFWLGAVSLYMFGGEIAWPECIERSNEHQHTVSLEDLPHPNPDSGLVECWINKGGIRTSAESVYLATHFANRICQSIAFCMEPDFTVPGIQLNMPPTWAALQLFRDSAPERLNGVGRS
ncbi:uncharacterized protein N7482_010373 [Penicillium canariense]|uniref:Zn(2)-C6 fungal-type domain-containing protein n=1 Tax=Penicillium canariense TaxID=189055 RepID=A0A9W9HKD9_9EURO|nr:uncharacterized protein N7482_010373 [Penicillium canariense]KAJ5151121.1 hypothetical protein N7482_010373 [Penicillium canariense]